MLIGPHSTKEQQDAFAKRIKADPPTLHRAADPLSVPGCRTIVGKSFEGRHVDLRPYIVYGKDIFVMPGCLTRGRVTEGFFIRQFQIRPRAARGSKDTWVLADSEAAATEIFRE